MKYSVMFTKEEIINSLYFSAKITGCSTKDVSIFIADNGLITLEWEEEKG